MTNDERAESLAAQAAAWVPPWERPAREPDRAYQARAEEEAAAVEPDVEPDDDEERSAAGLSDDDDDFDAEFEGGNPPGYSAPVEDEPRSGRATAADGSVEASAVDEPVGSDPVAVDAPLGDEPVSVDAPVGDDLDREPTDVGLGPELPVPDAVEQAAEAAEDDEPGAPVDAPLPADGDDAGDVFDAAADDDVSDDAEVDMPFAEEMPAGGEVDGGEVDGGEVDGGEVDGGEVDGGEVDGGEVDGGEVDGGEVDGGYADDGGAAFGGAADGGRGGSGRDGAEARAAVPEQSRGVGGGSGAVGDTTSRTSEVSNLPALLDEAELAAALEAILLVVDEPVAEMQLAQILEQPTERIATALEDISARYTAAGHGFDLRRAAGGWRLYTRPEYAAYVERFVLDGQSVRLTQAALETLAVVAYKQPVTRSRISAIRGVNCDGVMRTLVTRGLIEECGTEGETGAYLYRTTALFLEKLGLNSVDQLPPLAPFLPDDVEEVLDASG